jgi:predicted ATPase
MYGLFHASFPHILCGNYSAANTLLDQLLALADDKGSLFWKAFGMLARGYILALTGKASDTVKVATYWLSAFRSTSSTLLAPLHLSYLARAYADLGKFDDAWRCIGEAMTTVETRKERWCEAETHRTAGEIALMLPDRDTAKAEAHFERALVVARGQQAKSWELRAAMSLARLRCVQGRRGEARDLLGPVYGWFTQGFDTRDLKEAKAFLEDLASGDSQVKCSFARNAPGRSA